MVVCGENGKSSKERMPWGRSNTILGSISFCFVGLFPSYAQMLVPILPDGSSAWERDSFSAEKYGGEFLFCQIAAQPCPLPARLYCSADVRANRCCQHFAVQMPVAGRGRAVALAESSRTIERKPGHISPPKKRLWLSSATHPQNESCLLGIALRMQAYHEIKQR